MLSRESPASGRDRCEETKARVLVNARTAQAEAGQWRALVTVASSSSCFLLLLRLPFLFDFV